MLDPSKMSNVQLASAILYAIEDGATVDALYPLGREMTECLSMSIDNSTMVIETRLVSVRVPDCDWRPFSQAEIAALRELIRVTLVEWLKDKDVERV